MAGIRSPSISFHVEVRGSYTVGPTQIGYTETANVEGPDRSAQLGETIDGETHLSSFVYAKGLLYQRGNPNSPWQVDGSPQASQFGSIQFLLQPTLVLGDLGVATPGSQATYRLRVSSGVDLFPPQLVDGTVASPHNQQERLEFTIDRSGTLLSAHETRSVDGTIAGAAGTATGAVDYTFSQFGVPTPIVAPALPAGQALPTPQAVPSAIPTSWTSPPAGSRGFTVEFPGTPAETTGTIHSARANADLMLESRIVTYPSGLKFYEQDAAYPAAYLAAHPVAEQLQDTEQGGAADVDGQLVGSLNTTVAGLPAVTYVIATRTTIYRVQAFLVGDRLVIMSAVGSPQEVASSVTDEFFASVELTH